MSPDPFSPSTAPSTCKLNWDHISPGQQRWFCEACQHHVQNLSAMTEREARKFMAAPMEGRRCVSYLQEEDGRAIFQPERRPVRSFRAAAWLLISALFSLVGGGTSKAHSIKTSLFQPAVKPAPKPVEAANSEPQAAARPPVAAPNGEKPAKAKLPKRFSGF